MRGDNQYYNGCGVFLSVIVSLDIIKKNNKANNKSLNKVKKTAKAVMPKKTTSKTTN